MTPGNQQATAFTVKGIGQVRHYSFEKFTEAICCERPFGFRQRGVIIWWRQMGIDHIYKPFAAFFYVFKDVGNVDQGIDDDSAGIVTLVDVFPLEFIAISLLDELYHSPAFALIAFQLVRAQDHRQGHKEPR